MLPCIFVNHGGGPMPLFAENTDTIRAHLLKVGEKYKKEENKPRAILVISAHFETKPSLQVTSNPKPSMYFDYYGFPKEAYEIRYDAPGSPELAQKVKKLLSQNNIPCDLDSKRGFDHGVFVPLMIAFPEANIPVVTLSLHASFDPQLHINIGKALKPLREDNVLIIGSGMSFHNMRSMMSGKERKPAGHKFNEALSDVVTNTDVIERNKRLVKWDSIPGARDSHPREEHFLPLLVIAGAAGDDIGTVEKFLGYGSSLSGYSFP